VLTGSKKSGTTESGQTVMKLRTCTSLIFFPQTYHIETLVRLRRAP